MHTMANSYALSFTEKQWEEIEALAFPGFDPRFFPVKTRGEWMAIQNMLLGKALRIERGDFSLQETDGDEIWAGELRLIADVIYREFKAGDGKI